MAFWLWMTAGAIVLASWLIAASLFRVRVRYSRSGKLDQLIVIVRALYGLVQFQINVPSIVIRGFNIVYPQSTSGSFAASNGAGGAHGKKTKRRIRYRTVRRYWKAYRMILLSTKNFRKWARLTLKKVECTRWRLDVRVGTGDAALTAVAAGAIWSALGIATAATGHFLSLRTTPHGSVEPVYSGSEFSVVWEADFQIRAGTAIAAGIGLVARTVRLRKSVRAWRNWLTGPERI